MGKFNRKQRHEEEVAQRSLARALKRGEPFILRSSGHGFEAQPVIVQPKSNLPNREHDQKDLTDYVLSSDYQSVHEIAERLEKFAGHYTRAHQEEMKGRSGHPVEKNLLDIEDYLIRSSSYKNSPPSFAGTLDLIVEALRQSITKVSYNDAASYINRVIQELQPVIELYRATAGRRILKTELRAALASFETRLHEITTNKPQLNQEKLANPVLYMGYYSHREARILLAAEDLNQAYQLLKRDSSFDCFPLKTMGGLQFLYVSERIKGPKTSEVLSSNGIPFRQIDSEKVFGFCVSDRVIDYHEDLRSVVRYYNKVFR